MPEITLITMTGITKICPIADDLVLTYYPLVELAYKELSYSPLEYKLRLYNNGEEDSLTPTSVIDISENIFVLPMSFSIEKTIEFGYYIIDNRNYIKQNEALDIYKHAEELLNDGVNINTQEEWAIRMICSIFQSDNIKFVELIISHGFIVDCRATKYYVTNGIPLSNNIQTLLLSAGFNSSKMFRIPYNINQPYILKFIKNLTRYSIFLEDVISNGILHPNTLICDGKYPLFYELKYEDLVKYKDIIDPTILNRYGHSLLSRRNISSTDLLTDHMKLFPQIDINLQYNIQRGKTSVAGDTLLHILCRSPYINMSKIKVLLQNGAKLIENNKGETPIDILKQRKLNRKRDPVWEIMSKYFGLQEGYSF